MKDEFSQQAVQAMATELENIRSHERAVMAKAIVTRLSMLRNGSSLRIGNRARGYEEGLKEAIDEVRRIGGVARKYTATVETQFQVEADTDEEAVAKLKEKAGGLSGAFKVTSLTWSEE